MRFQTKPNGIWFSLKSKKETLTLIARNISKEHFVNESEAAQNYKDKKTLQNITAQIFNMLKANKKKCC